MAMNGGAAAGSGHGRAANRDAGIPRRTSGASAPMSFAQELVWLLDRANPGLTAYNVPRAIRIVGKLDVDALSAALNDLVERHEILRTVYAAGDAGAVQKVNAHAPSQLQVTDLSELPSSAREAEVLRIALAEARTSFDLAHDLLLRSRLLKSDDRDHTLILVSHHIASDGWSRGVMYRELSAAYSARTEGRAPTFEPLPIQYGDFAAWQREQMRGDVVEEHLAFWRQRLAAPLPVLDLPTDFPRPATQAFEGGLKNIMIPTALVQQLRELGMDHGATMYMVLLAAYQTVLHRYSGQDDILTGSPIVGRNHSETEGLIGYFNNILAMRNSFAGDPTFGDLLDRVAENAIDAYEHEDVPFEKLVLDLREGQATPSHAPLFSCVLTMEDTLPDELTFGDADIRPYALDFGQAKFDLTLQVAEKPDGLRIGVWYRTDLFTAEYAERFLGHLKRVLEEAVKDADRPVSALPILTESERDNLKKWNDTGANEGPVATAVQLFEQQAARVPDRVAVAASDGSSITYAELNTRANQLATMLRARRVEVGEPVGLLLDRSVEAIVALVGILKSGGAYMPLSVDAPDARIADQLRESRANLAVTTSQYAAKLPSTLNVITLDGDAESLARQSTDNPWFSATPDSVAYVLFTSGSTGVPKGVAVTHTNIVHYTRAVSRVLGDVPRDANGDGLEALDGWKFALASTLAADLGNTSLYPALLAGGTLHVLGKDVTSEPAQFASYMSANKVDVIKITPNHLVALLAGKRGSELAAVMPAKFVITGGEALKVDVARMFLSAGTCRVLNHYGPTETTVGVCTFEVTQESLDRVSAAGVQSVPVGRPLVNTYAYVVDAKGHEVPVGVIGELLIGGWGVTQGYLNNPDRTGESFVQHNGERVYCTGDRVRRLADGAIEFLGRGDHQIKIRGYRVELGDIEQVLVSNQGVQAAIVVLHTSATGDGQLIAYVVPVQEGYAVAHADRPTVDKIREWVAAQLPDYMVPSAFVMLDALPLTANGKVDRAALPSPDAQPERAHVAPSTETERQLAVIWATVLKVENVGVTDRFLDLGGHSLLAIRVLGRISKELGVRLALRTLFETPTIAEIAGLIDAERAAKEAEQRKKAEEAAMLAALADIENLSDDEVAQLLGGDGTSESR